MVDKFGVGHRSNSDFETVCCRSAVDASVFLVTVGSALRSDVPNQACTIATKSTSGPSSDRRGGTSRSVRGQRSSILSCHMPACVLVCSLKRACRDVDSRRRELSLLSSGNAVRCKKTRSPRRLTNFARRSRIYCDSFWLVFTGLIRECGSYFTHAGDGPSHTLLSVLCICRSGASSRRCVCPDWSRMHAPRVLR